LAEIYADLEASDTENVDEEFDVLCRAQSLEDLDSRNVRKATRTDFSAFHNRFLDLY